MYLTDYHTHSCCSFDSEAPLLGEVEQAVRVGLKELCTTDHCDLIDGDGKRVYDLDWKPILTQYEQTRSACGNQLNLRLGLELGCAQTDPECARRILSGVPLDFVIGSIHNLSMEQGGTDFYFIKYQTQTNIASIISISTTPRRNTTHASHIIETTATYHALR